MREREAEPMHRALARWVAAALRAGALVAVALIGAGYAWALLASAPTSSERGVVAEISMGGGDGVVAVGLLALTLLPIAVLVVAAYGFARGAERRMAVMTVLVAGLLAASLAAAALIGPAI